MSTGTAEGSLIPSSARSPSEKAALLLIYLLSLLSTVISGESAFVSFKPPRANAADALVFISESFSST